MSSRVVSSGRAVSTVKVEEYEQVLEKLRLCEDEKMTIIKDHGDLMKEFNKRMHVHIEEIRLLKEVNQKLQADMQELRDLCCYLDDDRHKCRKLAREWQRFGRYTATVMRNEVTAYQDKLRTLELRQNEVSTDNNQLKELCLYLDEQRQIAAGSGLCSKCLKSLEAVSHSPERNIDVITRGITRGPGYSEKLEARLSNIGTGNSLLLKDDSTNGREQKKKVSFSTTEEIETDTDSVDSRSSNPRPSRYLQKNGSRESSHPGILRNGMRTLPKEASLPFPGNSNMTPEAVAQAMKVLEIHEKLEHQRQSQPGQAGKEADRLDESEVAVLKEMCNVVWRKLSSEEQPKHAAVNGNNKNDDEILEDLL